MRRFTYTSKSDASGDFGKIKIYGNVWGLAFFCDGKECPSGNPGLESDSTLDWSKPISWDDAAENAGPDFNNVTSPDLFCITLR